MSKSIDNLSELKRQLNEQFESTRKSWGPIHEAILNGDLESVKRILKKRGPRILRLRLKENGFTCLHAACYSGHLDIVRFLIDADLEEEARLQRVRKLDKQSSLNSKKPSAANSAQSSPSDDHADHTSQAADDEHNEGEHESEVAGEKGEGQDQEEKKAKKGLDEMPPAMAIRDKNSWMPIHVACAEGHTKIVQHFVKKVDPNLIWAKDRYERTCLHLSCMMGRASTAIWLTQESLYSPVPPPPEDNEPLYRARDIWGLTPLHLAIEGHSLDLVAFLCDFSKGLAATAKKKNQPTPPSLLKIPAKDGTTPVLFAAAQGTRHILRYLLTTYPETVEDVDNQMQNIAHLACANGHLAIVEDLHRSEKYLHLFQQNEKHGLPPITLAKACGHDDVWKRLIRLGASYAFDIPEEDNPPDDDTSSPPSSSPPSSPSS